MSWIGYTVLAASTPGEAIRLAGEHPGRIHLLATDVIMPEMNGRELSARLQKSRPEMKCLFMSGYTANIIANQGVLEKGEQLMSWLIPSVIATASGTAILTVCFFYLYTLDRKNYLKIWAISWAVYFTRYAFLLITLLWQKSPWLLIANQMACLVSGVLLLYGTYLFINKKFPPIFLYLGVLGGLWIFIRETEITIIPF